MRIQSVESINTPPNLEATETRTGKEIAITDFNPQFRDLAWARVSVVSWTDKDGLSWSGNLFTPPNAPIRGRYPLVIQTHGFSRTNFLINGFPSGTGYAAQVLAGDGIVVLQAGELQGLTADHNSPEHLRRTVDGYEAAIDFLDRAGLIDRARVGLQGHSATSIPVLYAIEHPRDNYHFAAALRTGSCDFGYLNYLMVDAAGRKLLTHLLQGAPFGDTADSFFRNALPWHLKDVITPLMTQVTDARDYEQYVQCVWEAHEALTALSKPEELIVFPQGTHDLVKPWERLTSQQAAVDWFRFWLQGYEESNPAKEDQYRRWEKLCDQQMIANPGLPTYCVATQH